MGHSVERNLHITDISETAYIIGEFSPSVKRATAKGEENHK
jgi:hypothetical protein